MEKNIELEYRAVIPANASDSMLEKLKNTYEAVSHTRRLSYMGFWKSKNKQYDARVRITNGKSEVVLKIGDLHSHDRTELSQPITKDQISGFARMLAQIAPASYIAERETYNFSSDSGIVMSLVIAGEISYIEYELLSDESNVESNKQLVLALISEHGLTPLTKEGFDELNKKLDDTDWAFNDTPQLVSRFDNSLSEY